MQRRTPFIADQRLRLLDVAGNPRDVIARCRAYDPDCNRKWCQTTLRQLAAMNTFLAHGLLEPGCPKQIFWRDRSLQEYFAAEWLSFFLTPDVRVV